MPHDTFATSVTVHAGALDQVVRQSARRLADSRFAAGLFGRRPEAWSSDPAVQARIGNRLGWLTVVETMATEAAGLKRFAAAVRGHWSIENCLHWQLDVTFQEDQCRVRQGHADANLSILRRAALGLLKNNHSHKLGVKNKRLAAGWDDDYRLEILYGS